jgi:hypothetical protein
MTSPKLPRYFSSFLMYVLGATAHCKRQWSGLFVELVKWETGSALQTGSWGRSPSQQQIPAIGLLHKLVIGKSSLRSWECR